MKPADGRRMPAISKASVDLPLPESPSSNNESPAWIVRVQFFSEGSDRPACVKATFCNRNVLISCGVDVSAEDTSTGFAAASNTGLIDRKSTRLNSSHTVISYAVFCLKKKKHNTIQ